MPHWNNRSWPWALGVACVLCVSSRGALHAEATLGGPASIRMLPTEIRAKRLNGYLKIWTDGELSYYEAGMTYRPLPLAEGNAHCAKTRQTTLAYLSVSGIDRHGHPILYGLVVDASQCESFAEAIVTRQVRRRTESTSAIRHPLASVL